MSRAQRMGFEFFQTRSNVIILHRTILSTGIETVMSRKTEEASHQHRSQPSQLQSTGRLLASNVEEKLIKKNLEDVEKNDVEIDQQGTRAQGLPHSEGKEAEIGRVRELIRQIENHPNQKDLQEDLRQNNVYTLVSENSKKMVHEVGNVECLKLCETDPQLQCSCCLA